MKIAKTARVYSCVHVVQERLDPALLERAGLDLPGMAWQIGIGPASC